MIDWKNRKKIDAHIHLMPPDVIEENLFNVIDARYVSGKPMIITTNLHINELMLNGGV